MRTFHQLTLEEWEKYFLWKEQGVSLREIGRRLGRDHTTFSREPKRNAKYGAAYIPCTAHEKSEKRAVRQREKAPLKGPLIFLYVREHLRAPYCWSPETIAGRLPVDCHGYSIDDETIYRYIYGKKQKRMKLWRHLVLHRKKRMKTEGRKVTNRGEVVHAMPIALRPKSVMKRKQAGHWETDNMEGRRSDETGVSVSVERMARVVRIRKLADHTASTKTDALLAQFSWESTEVQHSITLDNGPENKDGGRFKGVTSMTVYKTVPYHSWEKGSVENTIGRLRRFVPKGTSVDTLTDVHCSIIEGIMNNTSRKCLGFLTPNEKLEKILSTSHIR